jgi:hypothetical protein
MLANIGVLGAVTIFSVAPLRAPPRVHAKSQMDGHSQCIDYFDDPLQTKNLCKGSLNISLDTPSYSALPFFEHA